MNKYYLEKMKPNILLVKTYYKIFKIWKKYVILNILFNDLKNYETHKYVLITKKYEINKIIQVIKKGENIFLYLANKKRV